MVSFRSAVLALASASAVVVSADYVIQPDSVPLQTREAWCQQQTSSCPTICLQTSTGPPQVNSCDAKFLTYGCVCSDGKQPNVSEYSLTLPYYVCTQWGIQCQAACGNDNMCASACVQNHPCGAQNPTPANKSISSTTSTTSATASATASNRVFNGLGDGSQGNAGTGGSGSGAGALRFGDSYGLAVVAAGLFAGFAALL